MHHIVTGEVLKIRWSNDRSHGYDIHQIVAPDKFVLYNLQCLCAHIYKNEVLNLYVLTKVIKFMGSYIHFILYKQFLY